MENNIITQFAQVFIHYFSKKSRTTTKIFISEPSKNIKRKFGKIFGIIEINTPSKENSRIINQLFSDLESIYYSFQDSGIKPQDAFEKTLKQVNDNFLEIVSKNTSSMVGNLNEYTIKEKINLIIGLIQKQNLVVTSLNAIGAYLIHKGTQDYKAIEIIKNENEDVSELKLFHNIITGEIKPNDYLLFCNNDFLNFISKERFTKTISSLPPNKAADYFKNSLLQHDGFNFAAIIIKLAKVEEEIIGDQKSLTSIHQLNNKESATEKLLSPSILPTLKANKEIIKNIFKKLTIRKSKTLKLTKTTSDTGFEINNAEPKTTNTQTTLNNTNIQLKFKKPLSRFSDLLKNVKNRFQLNIKYQSFKNYLKLNWNRLISGINKIPNLSKILILIACVSGLLFIYSIYFVNPDNLKILSRSKVNSELLDLSSKLDEAESKLIFNDNTTAKAILAETEDNLTQINVDNNQDQAYAQDLINRLNSLVAKLRKITIITDPNLLYDFNEEKNIVDLSILNDNLYVFDQKNNIVKYINIRSKELTTLQGIINGNIISANLEKDVLYFSTDTNYFYKIKNNNIINLPITLSSTDKIVDFSYYNERLYTLIPNKNQIYRHPMTNDEFFSGQTWIQEKGIDITKTNSIITDTRIWLATNDGQILKFFKGYKQALSLEEIEPKLDNITTMKKIDESENIYILDTKNNRIVVMSTEGELKTQYFSLQLDNITSFEVDENNKTLYISNGNKIYSIFMNHL